MYGLDASTLSIMGWFGKCLAIIAATSFAFETFPFSSRNNFMDALQENGAISVFFCFFLGLAYGASAKGPIRHLGEGVSELFRTFSQTLRG